MSGKTVKLKPKVKTRDEFGGAHGCTQAYIDAEHLFDAYEARIAELEAENAVLKPKFAVGDRFDVKAAITGMIRDCYVKQFVKCYLASGVVGFVREDEMIAKTTPVTPPTADEWYEAFTKVPRDKAIPIMRELAERHKAAKGENHERTASSD